MEGVLFDAEAGVRYVITEKTVRGGEAVKQSMTPAEGTAEIMAGAAVGCWELTIGFLWAMAPPLMVIRPFRPRTTRLATPGWSAVAHPSPVRSVSLAHTGVFL